MHQRCKVKNKEVDINMKQNKLPLYIAGALALLVLPFFFLCAGNAWVRIADVALLYVLLA